MVNSNAAKRLLNWYERDRRHPPWRAAPGELADPYRVWLSEVMLQQTTVATVIPYYLGFLERWPDVRALAQADLDAVLHAWQGLGYYARARNLHACAKVVVSRHDGHFPDTEDGLRALPGVGTYTAAAIAAIAFGRKAVVVDGNVERVMARFFAVLEPLPEAKARLRDLAATLTPDVRAGDYAQAVMDLGATLCSPRNPACGLCPWSGDCAGRLGGLAESLPRKAAKPVRPLRHGLAFWLVRPDGAVLLRRRPEKGLLGGMMEIPSTEWRAQPWILAEAKRAAPLPASWREVAGEVRHVFTHFELRMTIASGNAREGATAGGLWCPPSELRQHALPTLMKKLISHALRAG